MADLTNWYLGYAATGLAVVLAVTLLGTILVATRRLDEGLRGLIVPARDESGRQADRREDDR